MNIAIGSLHRSNRHNHDRYAKQCRELHDALSSLGHNLRVIAIEGDSNDGYRTHDHLAGTFIQWGLAGTLIQCNHGGPHFGSTEEPARLTALSKVANACFDAVTLKDDIFIYVESDLIWDSYAMMSLIGTLFSDPEVDIVAPLIFAGEHFYDVFLYRGLDGQRFAPFPPYHSQLRPAPELTRVQSAGSCLVMGGTIAHDPRHRMTSQALLDFCAAVNASGHRIFVNPAVKVYHP